MFSSSLPPFFPFSLPPSLLQREKCWFVKRTYCFLKGLLISLKWSSAFNMSLGGDKPQHGPLLVDPFQQQPLLIRWDWKTWLRDSSQTEEKWRKKVQFHWGGGVNRGEKTGMCAVPWLVHSSEMVQQALLSKAPSYHIPGPPGPLAALIITPDLSFLQEPGDYFTTWLLSRLDQMMLCITASGNEGWGQLNSWVCPQIC